MPARRPTLRLVRLRPWAVAVVVAVAAAGCKSSEKSGSGGSDPIFGKNIPRQDIPIPGKDSYGANDRDPLLSKGLASRDRDRFEMEPYRPGATSTPAALASKNRDDLASVPSLDDRPTGTPTGRSPAPFRPAADSGGTYEQALEDLRRLGVKWNSPRRTANGETVFECDYPMGPNGEGPFRRYEGVGTSEAAAARDAIRQIRSEPGQK